MMTADFTSGRMDWNTTIVDRDTVRTVKGKGPKKVRPASEAVKGLRMTGPSNTSKMDNLVASMENKDVLPPTPVISKGEGISARGEGISARGKEKKTSGFKKGSPLSAVDDILARYGMAKPKRVYKKRS